MLDKNDDLCQEISNLSGHASRKLLSVASGDGFAVELAMMRRGMSMRQELMSKDATKLEQAAVDNVVLAVQEQQYIDLLFASAAKRGDRLSPWVKLQETAARRVERSIKSLSLAQRHAARPVRTREDAEPSKNATPIAADAAKGRAGKVRTRSKPGRQKPAATVAVTSSVECNEQQHCETPTRSRKGANRTTLRPANRVAQFVEASGAPMSVSGQANHELPIAGGVSNGAVHSLG